MANLFPKLIFFVQRRLSPEGYFGLHLTLGALLMIGATWLFGKIAEDVATGDPLTVLDVRFSSWLHAHGGPTLTTIMLVITHLHSIYGIIALTLAFTIYLHRQKHRYWLAALLLAVCGGMLLNVVLKNVFHRSRPDLPNPILTFSSYGFPSGHTMAATCFWGVLCAFLVWKVRSPRARILVISLAALAILLVGFSRIYLGAHYLSDVLGALAEGLAWLALCFTAVNTIWRVRHPAKKGPEIRRPPHH